jgi:hypothetical protein
MDGQVECTSEYKQSRETGNLFSAPIVVRSVDNQKVDMRKQGNNIVKRTLLQK